MSSRRGTKKADVSAPLTKDEMGRLETYLRRTFGAEGLSVRARPRKSDSADVYLNGDFIAVVFKEREDGEVSYQFQMAILDIDLDGA